MTFITATKYVTCIVIIIMMTNSTGNNVKVDWQN